MFKVPQWLAEIQGAYLNLKNKRYDQTTKAGAASGVLFEDGGAVSLIKIKG